MSYSQLNAEADRLAHALLERGVRRDDLVVIHAERRLDLLRMILATLKCGAGYLAVEPGYPPQRLLQMLRVAQPRLVLSMQPPTNSLEALLEELPGVALMDVSEAQVMRQDDPGIHDVPGQLAYVIYTSGSTGVPKGVVVEQAGMLNNQLSKIAGLNLDTRDVIAQTASCSFDISVWQWLTALLCGARVEVVPDEIAQDPRRLLQTVHERGITVLESVPSLVQAMLLEDKVELPTLRYLIATGEALPSSVARQWLERYPDIPLLNAYGPAECSDDVAMHWQTVAPPAEEAHVSIGRATPNNGLYVLGGDLQRLPAGAVGEICVAGIGIGRGYRHDPRRTAASFVPNPYGSDGERLYRTGDLGRYGPDGALEYLGRVDHQVKILGYRIELGEIEARLLEHPAVAAAAVLVAHEEGEARRLVAYVVPAETVGSDEARTALRERLRTHLLQTLPKYMVPAQYAWLTKLPLSDNGKIDRQALSEIGAGAERPVGVAPRNATEAAVAQIWREVLKVSEIGVHDDFFAAGGHSLLATQVASRIRHRLGVEVPLRGIFEAPTIAALAQEIERCSARSGATQEVSLMGSLLEALETP